jgi:hypothetical protein
MVLGSCDEPMMAKNLNMPNNGTIIFIRGEL